jgi:heptosyltransferase-1
MSANAAACLDAAPAPKKQIANIPIDFVHQHSSKRPGASAPAASRSCNGRAAALAAVEAVASDPIAGWKPPARAKRAGAPGERRYSPGFLFDVAGQPRLRDDFSQACPPGIGFNFAKIPFLHNHFAIKHNPNAVRLVDLKAILTTFASPAPISNAIPEQPDTPFKKYANSQDLPITNAQPTKNRSVCIRSSSTAASPDRQRERAILNTPDHATRVLIVKTSSLGDIIHTLPAVTDAVRAHPGLRCDWVVERPFVELPAWHPAIDRVIACDLRQWRRRPLRTLAGGTWGGFRKQLRQRQYDLVIDAQGLLKSAVLARIARGPLAGSDRRSAREPPAALLYDRRFAIPPYDRAHAVERNRRLFAQALGYTLDQRPGAHDPDFGLAPGIFPLPGFEGPYVVFLHGTTWASKRWPVAQWAALARWLAVRGLRAVLPWGNAQEHADARTIAVAADGVVLPKLGLGALAGWLAHARACVGVDTGLAHVAAALGTPQVTLYGPTLPTLTGAVGRNQVWLRSGNDSAIDRARPNTVTQEALREALSAMLGT